MAGDVADVKEKGPVVDGCGESLFPISFCPKANCVDGCPKPAKGLLSEDLISLANGLGLADAPKTKASGAEAVFGWSPKTPGALAPNENAPPPRVNLESTSLPFGVDWWISRVGLSSM